MTPGSNREEICRAAELIRAGKLVAFPTETVYGLGANALDASAVRRIFEAKGRPASSPLIVHVNSPQMAKALASDWPESARVLAEWYWPGPLTIVVRKAVAIPAEVTAGLDTVGLRMPAHPMALELITEAGVPIAAPSANLFSQLSPTTAEHVRRSLGNRADMILDGGATVVGIESTVVSVAGSQAALLRPGMISLEEIEARIGRVVLGAAGSGAHESPGMHRRHYSPRTPLLLLEGGLLPARGDGAYLVRGKTMPEDPAAYAATLYATLHEMDTKGLDWIAVEMPPDLPEWAAIRDRLTRAAAGGAG